MKPPLRRILSPRIGYRKRGSKRDGRDRPQPLLHPLIALVASLLLLPALAEARPTTIEVAINGMVCSFCAQGIERKLRSLPATESVRVDLEQRLVSLTLKPGGVIADAQLRRLIRDAGFDVRQIQRIPPAQ